MRVIEVTRFGDPEVLVERDAPEPVAGPGQAVVAVVVADVLFLDTQLRAGWGQDYFGRKPPYVPGTGVAGEVVSVGDGVDSGWVGRRVVAMVDGAYAEQAVASSLIPVPDGLGLRAAAALLQTGPAALSLLDAAAIKPGERVLITAAGGGLGSLLVQAAGGRVTAAAGNAAKLAKARELGAETTIDYSEDGWASSLPELDVVFDGVGGRVGRAAFERMARGGRFFAYGVPSGGFAEIDPTERPDVTVRGIEQVQFTPEQIRELGGRALAEATAGRLVPVIGRTFPLSRAADAHTAIESRDVIGKTLLLI